MKELTQATTTDIFHCTSGATLINVIGDNAARAFGILGIGSFVRFCAPTRSAMKCFHYVSFAWASHSY